MHASAENANRRRQLPHWLVALVVLLTGAFTMWAMSMTKLRGPTLAWEQAHNMVDDVWGQHDSAPVPQLAPTWTAAPPAWTTTPPAPRSGGPRQVAGFPGVPAITAGARRIHADRGVCTNCHTVLTAQGARVPSITSLSVMPHAYRGVCSNCHEFTFGTAAASRPVARVIPGTAAIAPPAPAKKQPTEAEWQGMELAPTARGVVVAGVEGVAAQRGVLVDDVVASVNGVATPTMADFVAVTRNGKLRAGTMIVRRAGQRLAFELGAKPATTPQAPPPGTNFLPPRSPVGPQQAQF